MSLPVFVPLKLKYPVSQQDTLLATNNLAYSYVELGQTKKAADILEGVLAAQKRILGEEHPYTLMTMNNLRLAILYSQFSQTKDASDMPTASGTRQQSTGAKTKSGARCDVM
jgi:hypothetical protein